MSTATREYELILILDESDAETLQGTKRSVDASLQKRGAQIKETQDWGSRRLFHPVRHMETGHFIYYVFEAPGKAIANITQDLRLNTGLLKTFLQRRK